MKAVVRETVAGVLALVCTTMACSGPRGHADRAAATPAAEPSAICEPAPEAVETTISVKNTRGSLEGTLLLPAGCGPHTVALIVPGSGPTDRDGDQPNLRAQPYRLLAEALVATGIGTLRYDKAGIGASKGAAPAEADLRFEMGADDAALFIEALRADERIGRVGVLGHSEGGLVGTLAAQRTSVDAFVSIAGAGRPAGEVLREQLSRNLGDADLRARAFSILSALERGERVADVPPALSFLFRPSVQGYLISWMKYDPAAELGKLSVSDILVVQGTTDIQVSITDAERLAAARSDARLLVIEGMNHVLKSADASSKSQEDAYTNPDLPIVPELTTELAAFFGKR